MAQAGLLHPSALQVPGAHEGIAARSHESVFPWGKDAPAALGWAHARRVGSWAGLYISVAPARKSRSESPSEVKKSLTVPRHNAGGSPWPVVDAGLRGDSSRPSPPSDDRAGDIVKSSIPEKPSQPVWRRSWRSLSHTTPFWLKESTLQTGIAPENGAREEETGK